MQEKAPRCGAFVSYDQRGRVAPYAARSLLLPAGTARWTAPRQEDASVPILTISSRRQPIPRRYSPRASPAVLAVTTATVWRPVRTSYFVIASPSRWNLFAAPTAR